MRHKNKKITGNKEYLKTLQDEYRSMGFDTKLEDNELTVFSLRRRKPKRKEEDDKVRR